MASTDNLPFSTLLLYLRGICVRACAWARARMCRIIVIIIIMAHH